MLFPKSKPVRRSSFQRAVYVAPPAPPLRRVERTGVIRAVGEEVVSVPKGIKAKPGKRAPTVEESAWMDRIVAYGCIACHLEGWLPRPTAVHHIVDGGRRLGHLFALGLCDPGHHQNGAQFGIVSRHPYKARFEAKYGTELELLALTKTRLGVFDKAEYRA